MSDTDTQAPQTPDPAAAATSNEQEDKSKASEQEAQKVPEATQDKAEVKETEAPETKAEATTEDKLFVGKYKTADDLEKAYKELKDKHDKEASDKAELTRFLNEAFSSPEPATQGNSDTDDDDYQDEDTSSNSGNDQLHRDVAVTKFIIANGDADPAAMKDILTNDPDIAQINGYEAKLKYAYAVSQNRAASQALEEAKKTSAAETQSKILEKQGAQVESAKQQAQPPGEEKLTKTQLRATLRDNDSFDNLISKKYPGISKMKTPKR